MQSLHRSTAAELTDASDMQQLSYSNLAELFLQEHDAAANAPSSRAAIDPRNSEPVVYSSARRRRPVDYNRHVGDTKAHADPGCIICAGKTTRIVDLAELSEGFTFINKNLYPAVWPASESSRESGKSDLAFPAEEVRGLHFLQWTSSIHDLEWHTMPLADARIVMSRLAILEKQLLSTSSSAMPSNADFGDPDGYSGFVSIIKNGGAEVGGSLEHSHQQIIFSNLMPRRIMENWRFQQEHGIPFSKHILHTTPPNLVLREYETAVLLIPTFMRRPGDMLLLVKDTRKRYLHQLSPGELRDVSRGWQDAISAIHSFMPALGRPTAYNVTTLNGPGAGLHFAFLPYTQETGGFEQLGLSVCQAQPAEMAEIIRSQHMP
mgnify:FL=1